MKIVYGANYGRPTLDLNFARNKSLIDTISGQNFVTFTRSSTGTYVDSDGLIKTASVDTPRFDHDPLTGVCNGLLIEESRTNLVTHSEQFDNAAWSKNNATITSNAILAPDGSQSAEKLVTTNGTTRNLIYQINTNSAQKTVSCFVKSAEWNFASIGFSNIGGVWSVATFNLITGQYVSRTDYSTPNISGYSISPAGNGWYRISATITGATNFVVVMPSFTSGDVVNPSWTGDGTSGIYIWGAQLELGSFPTSYIPTDGTPGGKTRSADFATITGTNFSRWYNQSENTVFCQGISASRENSGYYALQGSVSNGSSVLVYPANTITWQVFDTSFQVNTTLSTYNLVSSIKSAVAMKSNDFAGVINGGSIVTDNSGTVPSVTSLVIGNYLGGGASYDYTGTINRLTYYPTRLQNYQLQQLTK